MMKSQLKPMRYPQGDLFVCDITDVILKDDLASMEHPFYSLSKNPDRQPRRYEHNSNWIEFRPSIKGLPTIYDKDLIIYAVSQLMAGIKEGRPVSKTVEIDPYSFLVFTERGTGGRDYKSLVDSLDRLDGTRFRTNILFEGTRTDKWMGLIDSAALDQDEKTGKLKSLRITLSDMVMQAIVQTQVLTLHRDYFRLSRPIERRIYELGRKHCGNKLQWKCSIKILHKKTGSRSSINEFRRAIKPLFAYDKFPDYDLSYLPDEDKILFINRKAEKEMAQKKQSVDVPLKTETYQKAREAAPTWDVYYIEREWQEWMTEPPRHPDAAFLAFCRKWYEKRGRSA